MTFIVGRLVSLVPVLFGITLVVFMILHLTPGDPALLLAGPEPDAADVQRIRTQLGLDQPLHVQYFTYLGRLLQGDLGTSLRAPRPVSAELAARLPRTLELAALAMLVALAIGVPIGVLSAVKQYSWLDHVTMLAALSGVSMPGFWLGLLLIILFASQLKLLPVSGYGGPFWTAEGLQYAILPATTLGLGAAAYITRLTRSAMLDVIRQDYIRTARAKGLHERGVLLRHALRNALIPVVTMVGIQFGFLLGGSIIVETVFSWPGMGRLIVTSIFSRDYPVVQGAVLMMGLMFVAINLLVDVIYGLLDPRIRVG